MSKARDIADLNTTILDSVESGATADQTNAEIRAAVEAATDSNVFTDADHTKLNSGVATVIGSETLTNKTLTSPDINTPDIDGGTIDGSTVGASSASTGAFTTLSASGDVNFDSGTLFVDASANKVGFGTVSPTGELHVKSASSNANFYLQRSVYDPWRLSAGAGYLAFLQDSSEKMRLSGGNLLVGKTSQATATIGAELGSSGYVSGSRDGNTAGFFNRTTSDGEVLRITKNGVSVGSIGVINGNNLTVGGSVASHAGLQFGGNVSPMLAGVQSDGGVDLGAYNLRWKDLHLSGVMAAGNGSASAPSVRGTDTNTGLFFPSGGVTCFTQNGVERGRWDASGSINMGVTTPTHQTDSLVIYQPDGYALYSGSNGTGGSNHMVFGNANSWVGSIATNGSATSYSTSSDYRLKENVVAMTGSIDRVKALKPSRFNFIADADNTVDGFLAHEAANVVPECVTGTKDAMKDEEYEVTAAVEEVRDEDDNVTTEAVEAVMGTRSVPDYQGIDQAKLVPLLVAALQEAIARIETLEAGE